MMSRFPVRPSEKLMAEPSWYPLCVCRWQTHVTLLINRVIALLVGAGGVGNSGGVEAWLSEHHVERVGASAAPAPDRHTGDVDVRVGGGKGANGLGLLVS